MMTPQQKKFVNQRASARYRMVTALRYRAFRQAAVTCSGSGQSIDMSSGGIAIEIGRVLDPGTEVELALDWTGLYHGKRKMRLLIWGEVVRSSEQSTAVRILSHEFREASARAVA
jgi:PilZ domain